MSDSEPKPLDSVKRFSPLRAIRKHFAWNVVAIP